MGARIHTPEIMDIERVDRRTADEVYRYLARVNRRLGGVRATIARFEAFSRSWRAGERIEVLDVACGAADVPRALIAWGRAQGFDLRVSATDILPEALRYARQHQTERRLRLACADVDRPPFRDGSFDYVTCALFFHHLTDDRIVATLRSFDRLARRGIVVNDLIRSRRAFLWTWLLTWPFHPVLHHDGPLSVRRALTPGEMRTLAAAAGLPWLTVRRHFGHRMTLAGEKGPRTRAIVPRQSRPRRPLRQRARPYGMDRHPIAPGGQVPALRDHDGHARPADTAGNLDVIDQIDDVLDGQREGG
jgi:SAM-dependent methyltransferase